MKIRVNGRDIDFFKKSIQDLLDQYGMNPARLVIEKNGVALDTSDFKREVLSEGDAVEIGRKTGRRR